MQIILNEQGYVKDYAIIGSFGLSSIFVEKPDNLEDFEQNYGSYYLSNNGILVKSQDQQNKIDIQRELDELRQLREKSCFPIVNRGILWYEKLTAEQKEELNAWYEAWLDVTETKVMPEPLVWLD